jgi:NAD+ diphosphatase
MTMNSETDTSVLPFNTSILDGGFTPLKPGDSYPDVSEVWLLLKKNSLLVREEDGQHSLPEITLPKWAEVTGESQVVGLWQGQLLRVFELGPATEPPAGYALIPFQGVDATLDLRLSTLAGLGGQILHWERFSRYCPACAAEQERIPGTWGKRCPVCRSEHFPHIHPCVIVLIRKGDHFLLVRNVSWPDGRFSLIAGFLDFGESLEECVRREVREEAGVEVTNIRYVGSQAWPFPSQLMVGFIADYAGGEPRADGVEVAETGWFTSKTLPYSDGNIRSISRWIMSNFGQSHTGPEA